MSAQVVNADDDNLVVGKMAKPRLALVRVTGVRASKLA